MTYYKIFDVGDVVKALRQICFADLSVHEKDSVHQVTLDTEAYFNINRADYTLIAKQG